jgi:hypothetical protein
MWDVSECNAGITQQYQYFARVHSRRNIHEHLGGKATFFKRIEEQMWGRCTVLKQE